MCFQRQWCLYKFRPKFHLGCHIVRELREGDIAALNPTCSVIHLVCFLIWGLLKGLELANVTYLGHCSTLVAFISGWGCWQDEDHIGRCSRVSRSCHPLLAATRTIQKVLSLYMQQMRKIH